MGSPAHAGIDLEMGGVAAIGKSRDVVVGFSPGDSHGHGGGRHPGREARDTSDLTGAAKALGATTPGSRYVDAQVEPLVGLRRRVEGPLESLVQRIDDLWYRGPGVVPPGALAAPVC